MKNQILNNAKSEEASALLNSWANCFLTLESKYYVRRNEVSNRDYDFLKLIGQSIYYLNSCNSLLIASIENFKTKSADKKLLGELSGLSSYMRFFNSLVASKIKFFFFRETPIKNTNNPFVKIDLPILRSGNELIKELSKEMIDINAIIIFASKYFYLQTLLYSFIYHSKKEKGVFLKFQYNKKSYIGISEIISNKYSTSTNEQDVRFLGSNIIAFITNYYLDDKEKCNIDDSYIEKPKCYDNLFLKIINNTGTLLEPLTYHLSDMLWKIDGMVHDDNEFLNSSYKNKHDVIVIDEIKKFISTYLATTQDMYSTSEINYLRLYEDEKNFIQKFYPLVFEHENIKTVRSKFEKLHELSEQSQDYEKINLPIIRDTNNDLISVFNKVRKSGEHGFKIETLIEVLSAEDLTLLFQNFSKLIPIEDILDRHTEFIGFYKSGIFLGHINNLLNDCKKPVWLFKSKPYVATHPVHEDEEYNDFNKIIIFDECLKTGFTYSLYESYLTRNLYNSHFSTALYALFDFTYYTRIEFNDNVNFHSLIKLNDVNLPVNINELAVISKIQQSRATTLNIKNINIGSCLNLLKYTGSCSDISNRVDLTFLLSDTQTIFYICNVFADKIIDRNTNGKTIHLSTASSDGEVLTLITAFILKLKKQQIKFGFNKNSDNDVFSVAIDLSLVTGFSLAHLVSMKENEYFKSALKEALDSFDLICSILTQGEKRENSFSLYQTQ